MDLDSDSEKGDRPNKESKTVKARLGRNPGKISTTVVFDDNLCDYITPKN